MDPQRPARPVHGRHLIAFMIVGLALAGRLVHGQEPAGTPASKRVETARVVVLSTMLADSRGVGEWGFAALVEADGHRLLFDTGARPETALANARELGVDLASVETVILSHHHGDHTGGLLTLRKAVREVNPKALARAYVGRGIFLSRPEDPQGREGNETAEIKAPYEALGGTFVEVSRPTAVFPGVWLTGPVPRVHPEKNWSLQRKVREGDALVDDTVPEDMSLVLDTERGLVVVSGCGHAGVVNTLEYARKTIRPAPIHAALGGFHLFQASDATLDWTASQLRAMNVGHVLGAHCTGIEAVYALRSRLGLDRSTCVVGAVGSGFELGKGLQPGAIAR